MDSGLIQILRKDNISKQSLHLYLRAFKAELVLEVWAKSKTELYWQHLRYYAICKSSGQLGPKRQEGDRQIPEGLYHIDRFNPNSKYHVSLGLNYPNSSDRILGDPEEPGSDIFIHGGCETVGCIPITDTCIEELFTLAGWAKENGQTNIPVHIFPFRFTPGNWEKYSTKFPQHEGFWQQLLPVCQIFEKEKKLPRFEIDELGRYRLIMD